MQAELVARAQRGNREAFLTLATRAQRPPLRHRSANHPPSPTAAEVPSRTRSSRPGATSVACATPSASTLGSIASLSGPAAATPGATSAGG